VIEQIHIEGIRGIREGLVKDLTRLNLLVGPNGSGKSTVLDAALVGCSPVTGDAVGRAVSRRTLLPHAARDFFTFRGQKGTVQIHFLKGTRTCTATFEEIPDPQIAEKLERRRAPEPYSQIATTVDDGSAEQLTAATGFDGRNNYVYSHAGRSGSSLPVRMVDPTQELPLDQLYSDLVKQGRRKDIKKMLRQLIPSLDDIELLTDLNHRPSLYLVDAEERTVPLALAGDGIIGFARLGFTLLSRNEPLVLIEEPEVHQHPGCIRWTADALLRASRNETQMLITTHSLDLIDYLIDQASEDDLEHIALYMLKLDNGQLKTSRLTGHDVKTEREQISRDLR